MATDSECLILGCPGTGKSLLVQRLKDHHRKRTQHVGAKTEEFVPTETMPTSGQEVDFLKTKRKTVCIREVGGSLHTLWPDYVESANKIIFVVDIANPPQLGQSIARLYELCQGSNMQHVPLLLVLSKNDCPHRMTETFISEEARLNDLQELGYVKAPIEIIEVSNLSGNNVGPVYEWCVW
eukprot:gb/GECG01006150.1/.p1 GENE.gb/GECG01006150.1/~~gb/GECG01006150.1/.p1  ORF type:complete len:181 (+),score=22.14 gb/GECG01006150.1/:1-543(+)